MAKFNGENFALWKFQAQMVLQAMDLWNATQAPQPSLEEPNKRAEWLKANQKAFSVVCLGLELPQLAKVTTLTTVKEVFETLGKEFEAKTKDNQLKHSTTGGRSIGCKTIPLLAFALPRAFLVLRTPAPALRKV